jgi:RNA polymerase sigma factor (sigma-70 family)
VTAQPFEDVVAEHGAVVMRVCRALLDPAAAEDAWSETFLAALEAYPRLRSESNVRGWLITIAHRKAIDHLRLSARTVTTDTVPELQHTDGDLPDAELWDALRALPFKQRGAVAYHYIAGLPYADVAALLDSSEAAARRSAADGLANLRKTYQRSPA